MKIHACQHVPAFVDGVDRREADVDSLAALLAVPWIARWAEDDLVARDGVVSVRPFYRWSLSDHGTGRQILMAEYEQGDHFWVVAFVTSDEPLDLPAWTETETARLRRDRWNRGDTS